MPLYQFECGECSLEFERTLKMADNLLHPCPSCGVDAFRVWDGSMNFGFTGSQTGATANTGVHKEDYPTADHVVGRDAEARWGEFHERQKVKNAARSQGDTHALIRHNHRDYIDYEPMTQTGRQSRKKLADAVFRTMKDKTARRDR